MVPTIFKVSAAKSRKNSPILYIFQFFNQRRHSLCFLPPLFEPAEPALLRLSPQLRLDLLAIASMSWENFKTFDSKLRGRDVFDRENFGPKEVTAFLKDLRNDPTSYGILDSEHQKGVETLYDRILSKPVAEVAEPVKVKYHSVESDIRDFDSALGYVFSVYPLPANHTTSDTYLPLLAIYCRFIYLMTDPLSKSGMKTVPKTACVVVGAPPNKGAVKAIMFDSSIRSANKTKLQEHRHTQLLKAFAVKILPDVRSGLHRYGHCADTHPYTWNIKPTGKERKFEGPVQGIAVNILDVANVANFSAYKFPSTSWKPPCEKFMELLRLGGFPAYDLFPHKAFKNF